MGKGAFVKIQNETDEILEISYANFVDIYQNGEQGSNFAPISGQLNSHESFPALKPRQYIEAISTPYESRFDMILTWRGTESVTLKFVENYHEWWVENPFVKLGAASLQFDTVITSGDQYNIAISIKYTAHPESWMGDAYNKIQDTKLCMLPIPGSHDAISYPSIEPRSQTQNKTIQEQLVAGFRYFDFRVMVLDSVYYGYHGTDTTHHDYTSVDPNAGHRPFVLDDIADFLRGHEKELVILHFSHFAGGTKNGIKQQFNGTDAKNFVKKVQEHFAGKLVPRSQGPTVTYGNCINHGQQVVVIISDANDGSGDDKLAQEWYEYPATTPQGEAERRNSLFWMSSDCWLDRYSGVPYDRTNNLHADIIQTLEDQETYLAPPKVGETGHRDPDKFWVTQAVLNYAPVPFEGHSLNYWGSRIMNPLVTLIYEDSWRHGHSHPWNGPKTEVVSAPNILLLDFAGNFDGFPEACIRML